jgi:uncharacterized protein (TIGR02444 family)
MNFPESKFWDFSINTYQSGAVESACLQLQNKHPADINIILYCCWAGQNHIGLLHKDVKKLIATTRPWQTTILKPLRDARKTMKQHIIAMPADMLEQTLTNLTEMELNAERMSQLALEKAIKLNDCHCCKDKTALQCAIHNLKLYLQEIAAIESMNSVNTQLDTILKAIFQDPDAVQMALMPVEAVS